MPTLLSSSAPFTIHHPLFPQHYPLPTTHYPLPTTHSPLSHCLTLQISPGLTVPFVGSNVTLRSASLGSLPAGS